MQLDHSFTVPVGVETAWEVLLDIEQVAPCMPGAALETVDGDDFTGSVKVKLGPIALTYKGKASFIEKDATAHRAVIDAQGRDSRGNGTAGAKVSATLSAESESSTRVDVITDLNITGKPAQFGRGVMVDVGNKLIGQFADCLASKLAAGTVQPPAEVSSEAPIPDAEAAEVIEVAEPDVALETVEPAGTDEHEAVEPKMAEPKMAEPKLAEPKPAPPKVAHSPSRTVPEREVEPIDLMASAGPALIKRLAPVAAALVLLGLLFGLRRRRCSNRG